MAVELANVNVGDTFEVHFYDRIPRRPYSCMVTAHYGDSVRVVNIEVKTGEQPVDTIDHITEKQLNYPQTRFGRQILKPRPHFRRWANDPTALLGFIDAEHAPVPTVSSIDELARHEDGLFILTDSPASYGRDLIATFCPPFFDHTGRKEVIRQYATVFRMDDDRAELQTAYGATKYTLPVGVTFTQVDAGPVLYGSRGTLCIGTDIDGSVRRYPLSYGKYFAIETKVLVRAGLVAPTS